MNLFNRMLKGAAMALFMPEQRSSLENTQTPLSFPAEWLLDIFNGGRTDAGIRVSELSALQVSTVFACVNRISDGIASLPFHVFEHIVSEHRIAKKKAFNHSLYNTLHNEPNSEQTTPTFLKVMMVHALLWGNTFVEIERDNSNAIVGLWPRNPAKTRAIRLTKPATIEGDLLPVGTLLYETTDGPRGGDVPEDADSMVAVSLRRLILAEDMIHVPGLSLDGRVGQSTVWLCRQAIGLALATEKYGAKFFSNGARPAGILTVPNKLEDDAIEMLRRSWSEAHGGENAFKMAVLEEGVKFEKIASTPEEGQMLQTREHQRGEICSIFGVPLHMIAGADKGQGKSNVEQSSIEFVLYCLQPWITRLEKEFGRKLFPKMGRAANKFFPHFDTRRLMYPDAASRGDFYAKGRQWGFLNGDDIRELEDMNPIADGTGQVYWMPINMQDANNPQKLGAQEQSDLEAKQQMKLTQQQHDHQMEATAQGQKHELALGKAGLHPLQNQQPPSQPVGKGKKPAGKRSEGPMFEEESDAVQQP